MLEICLGQLTSQLVTYLRRQPGGLVLENTVPADATNSAYNGQFPLRRPLKNYLVRMHASCVHASCADGRRFRRIAGVLCRCQTCCYSAKFLISGPLKRYCEFILNGALACVITHRDVREPLFDLSLMIAGGIDNTAHGRY